MNTAKPKTTHQSKRTRSAAKPNPTTASFQVSDELWAVLEPLLPEHVNTHRFGGGRPRVPDRTCANGIFYVLRTGCQWKALDQADICSGSTAHARFQEWVEAGVFLKLWQTGLEQYEEVHGLDWSWLSMDGAMTKAPLGGEKNWAESHGSRQVGREAQWVDGRQRQSDRPGGRRRQSPRHETGA